MAKNIVFCADGTWNNPNEDENADRTPDPTNVYKLFLCLEGALSLETLRAADEQEKGVIQAGQTKQIAKYLHGVGDSRNPIIKLLGGAFGVGVITRVVRGYTFISRQYEPGDNIVIVGFSRGAYTARALAGLIVSQGVLAPSLTQDKELAYRRGAEAWYRYRHEALASSVSLAHLAEIIVDLPAFVSKGSLRDQDLIPVDRLGAVAVWDTVGAMGVPNYIGRDQRADAFKFANLKLSQKVSRGLHAVALDEQRKDFEPTLWEAAPNVTQALFPGAHCDVGGGYPMSNYESGLSDSALRWMIDQLAGVGVQFSTAQAYPIQSDPCAVAHQPWAHRPWTLPGTHVGPRTFPAGMPLDQSIVARMAGGGVVAEPGIAPTRYKPENLPK